MIEKIKNILNRTEKLDRILNRKTRNLFYVDVTSKPIFQPSLVKNLLKISKPHLTTEFPQFLNIDIDDLKNSATIHADNIIFLNFDCVVEI